MQAVTGNKEFNNDGPIKRNVAPLQMEGWAFVPFPILDLPLHLAFTDFITVVWIINFENTAGYNELLVT